MRRIQVAIDCWDPARLSEFWADLLGYRLQDPPAGYSSWEDFSDAVGAPGEAWRALIDPDGIGPRVLFHRVPEGKVAKNRVHLDIRISPAAASKEQRRPLVDAEAARLVGAGAAHLRTDDDETDYFAVMQDPEGNEFCIG
jgi:catechol 2,3-dioxygenase-like lactoylglutathione lyase family enzyme